MNVREHNMCSMQVYLVSYINLFFVKFVVCVDHTVLFLHDKSTHILPKSCSNGTTILLSTKRACPHGYQSPNGSHN